MARTFIPLMTALGVATMPAVASAARADNNVEWDGIHSDTTAQYVSPMAPAMGEAFTLRLRAYADDLTTVRARIWFSGPEQESYVNLSPGASLPGAKFTLWSAQISPPAGTRAAYWRFELSDGTDTDHYDAGAWADDPRYRGMSDEYRGDDNNFQLVMGFDTPSWSREAIWYQVFPERFYNGDPSNDSLTPDDDLWYLDWAPGGTGKDCEVHDSWDESPTGPCDFFGGDLPGVEDKLAYIHSLGANALYLNPVFRSRSNHKYDTMDYSVVDPRFGGDDALDSLVSAAHDRGWQVILDGVFNHSSDQSLYYNSWADTTSDPFYPATTGVWEDELLDQGTSPWAGWFKTWVDEDYYDVDRDGDLTEDALHTCGWYGFEFMPNIDYKSPNQPNSAPRSWLYGGSLAGNASAAGQSVAGMWLKDGAILSEGADGWRLDVPDNAGYSTSSLPANCSWASNDVTLWQGFRTAVKTVNPDAYITGEIWADATTNGGINWFQAKTFDAVMNYHYFAMPVSCYLNGSGVHETTGGGQGPECVASYSPMKRGGADDLKNLDAHLANQRRVYPAAAYQSSQNLISSHDTARWISRQGASAGTLKAAYFLQATAPGAPMVYYGDEIGLAGQNDPDNRRTFPWSSLNGASETELREDLSRLLCVRGSYTALSTGSWLTLDLDSSSDTWAYARYNAQDTVVAALNAGATSRTVRIPVARLGVDDGDTLIDTLTGDSVAVSSGLATVSLAGRSGVILVPQGRAAASASCRSDNQAPVADAGEDPLIVSTSDSIVLDGSGSYDPDGDALSYVWTNETGGVVGSSAVVTLPPRSAGSYVFFLSVSDGELSAEDSVVVEVEGSGTGGCNGLTSPVPLAQRGLSLLGLLLPVAFLRRRLRR